MPTKFDLSELWRLFHTLHGNVKYGFGAKAVPLSIDPKKIKKIDCSGWVRYAFYQCADGLIIPDGSWHQRAWANKHLRKLDKYSDVQYASEDPSRLFICFIPTGIPALGYIGHVILVCGGMTLESRGGKGIDSRPWHNPTYKKFMNAAYEIPTKA